ncbi:MAG: hypothetical protein WCG25_06845 [bacterium]
MVITGSTCICELKNNHKIFVVPAKDHVDGTKIVVFSIGEVAFCVSDILNQYFFNFAANKFQCQSSCFHKLLAKFLSIQFCIIIFALSIRYSWLCIAKNANLCILS